MIDVRREQFNKRDLMIACQRSADIAGQNNSNVDGAALCKGKKCLVEHKWCGG